MSKWHPSYMREKIRFASFVYYAVYRSNVSSSGAIFPCTNIAFSNSCLGINNSAEQYNVHKIILLETTLFEFDLRQ